MANKFRNLGDILNSVLTERQQASILTKMREEIRREEQQISERKRETARDRPPRLPRDRSRPRALRPPNEYGREHARALLAAPESSGAQTEARERASARVRHGQPGKAAYWTMTGEAPDCQPGDRDTAMRFYKRVVSAIEHGGWSHSERSALYDLETKWGARAHGRDPRFQIAGTRPGRLPAADERRIREWKQHNG